MKEEILKQVYKPGRYLGNEWNVVKKDLNSERLKFALCFPDLYEVGMSHLGFRIIYGLLNGQENILCERVFAPAEDLERLLRKDNILFSSLESDIPLKDFDIIGFSLAYELLYTNVLNVLDLAHIPLYSSQRSSVYPLVIAGGYACVNPEPMADFFDCFIIGEAEEVILEVAECVRNSKLKADSRKELLLRLAKISGVYVPSLYRIEYNHDNTIKSFLPNDDFVPAEVKKRIIQKLDDVFFPQRWLVPYIQIVHDRVILEIMRGCPNKCRFCQARAVYYPYRIRSEEKIMDLAELLLKNSGYEEISLLGLSCGDYPKLLEVLNKLILNYKDKGIGVSLPSLKIKDYIADIPSMLKNTRKTGLTFAPEAGSKRLRDMLNKDINIEELFRVISSAYKSGYGHVKLYFMFGLPEETREDLDAIAELAVKVVCLRKEVDGKLGRLTLSITAFNPKPHTAFERLGMNGMEGLKEKRSYILSKIRNNAYTKRAVKIDFHSLEMSFLETALSRSGRMAAGVIYQAFKEGSRFDSWGDKFNFAIWKKAFNDAGINPEFYANREIGLLEILPWGHIDLTSIG
ncbi:MAG: TIGR03960 family B12-binding radical SAM protein [Candidatus Omnitrophota bacterium]|nr:TIGR03960 family B12-binding radical SAM protein [Candidatus Omnitrophota bacterium]